MPLRKISHLVIASKQLKKSLTGQSEIYLNRAEYLIIKSIQLNIIDRRIARNIRNIELLRIGNRLRYWKSQKFQIAFSELVLDAESFFYTSSKFIDLLFEGLQEPLGFSRRSKSSFLVCKKILDIRNNLIEHSHRGKRHVADEVCMNGYNARYGPYLRSAKEADGNRPYKDRAYFPLRNGFIKEVLLAINRVTASISQK